MPPKIRKASKLMLRTYLKIKSPDTRNTKKIAKEIDIKNYFLFLGLINILTIRQMIEIGIKPIAKLAMYPSS